MKLLSIKALAGIAVASSLFAGCINSKEAYEKSKLSGFVADQTKDLIKKNPPPIDFSPVEKRLDEIEPTVQALDEQSKKTEEVINKLETSLATIEKLEKESKSEFERSNTSVIFFNSGSAYLGASSMQELYRWKSGVDQAKSVYNYSVEIYASADKTGSEYVNKRLRERRANEVKKFLVDVLGITAPVNITTEQPSHSKRLLVDRRVVVSVKCK